MIAPHGIKTTFLRRAIPVLACLALLAAARAEYVLFDDFNRSHFGEWTVTGTAFGSGPVAQAVYPHQQSLDGFLGSRFVTSFHPDDSTTGSLRSAPFVIERPYIAFLIGGGNHASRTCVNLIINDTIVDSVTAERRLWDNSELLRPAFFDVAAYIGETALLEILDTHTGGWGHINVDHIVFSNVPEPAIFAQPAMLSTGPFTKIYDPGVGENQPWYINDHCFIRGADGTWHLFGITREEPADPRNEILFAHASSPQLTASPWTKHPPALQAHPGEPWREVCIWAPHVIEHNGIYHMFYHAFDPGPPSNLGKIHLATSTDLHNWTRHPVSPILSERFDARDPMVLKLSSNPDLFIIYYTLSPEDVADHSVDDAVAYRTSSDLLEWSDKAFAYRRPRDTPGGGICESPFVVERKGYYYLFIGPRGSYTGTTVFRSETPYHWEESGLVAHLDAHAPEIMQDVDGVWYISHCGWGQGGVYLAPLIWSDPTDARSVWIKDGENQ